MHHVLTDYLDACATEGPEAVRPYLRHPDAQIDPCPGDGDTIGRLKAQASREVVWTADTPNASFIGDRGGTHIDPGAFFNPDAPQFRLRALKYALKNHDIPALQEILLPREGFDPRTWIDTPTAQAIYAAAAATPRPTFLVDGGSATCILEGMALTFEVYKGKWCLVAPGP